mgnify:CR=1 FL=1
MQVEDKGQMSASGRIETRGRQKKEANGSQMQIEDEGPMQVSTQVELRLCNTVPLVADKNVEKNQIMLCAGLQFMDEKAKSRIGKEALVRVSQQTCF